MAFGQCNACDRRHERPVGSKCQYFLATLEKCKEMRVDLEDYRKYLLPLGTLQLAGQGVKTTTPVTVSTPTSPTFTVSPADIKALILDS